MTGITTDGWLRGDDDCGGTRACPDTGCTQVRGCGPLVCAGITTFNALRNAARAGDTVAIQGSGRAWSPWRAVCTKNGPAHRGDWWGPDKEHLAQKFGAHIYIDAKHKTRRQALQKLGGRRCHPCDRAKRAAIGSLLPGLKTRANLWLSESQVMPIPVNGVPLIFGGRSVVGSLTGRAIETQDTIDFSVLTDIVQ